MKEIDDISKQWATDSVIDEVMLASASAKIPVLHNKYYMMYVRETLRLKTLRAELTNLQRNKQEYFGGTMTIEKMKELNWKPYQLKHLKSDLGRIVEQDQDVIQLTLKIGYFETVVKYLEDIIKQINNRNFIIKNMIDWNKFTSGSG